MKKINITKEFLEQEYIINKKSTLKIAKELNVSYTFIYNRLIEYNISRRKSYEHLIGTKKVGLKGKNHPMYGKHHSEETKHKIRSSTYHKNLKGKNNPSFNIRRYGIDNPNFNKRWTKEMKKNLSVKKGGTGIPYENNQYPENFFKIKPHIRKRDNYTCQNCKKTYEKHGVLLNVHHIDYNKTNCKEDNLITLCHGCNVRANSNRDYWYAYFKYIIGD